MYGTAGTQAVTRATRAMIASLDHAESDIVASVGVELDVRVVGSRVVMMMGESVYNGHCLDVYYAACCSGSANALRVLVVWRGCVRCWFWF
jgi:hypothetical protein